MDAHTLTSDDLTAVVSADGAELHSLITHDGHELIWQADKKWWGRHAPHLFPIVGRLNDDKLVHHGQHYPMTQHGFARDMPFSFETRDQNATTLLLKDNADTRAKYPFAFELRIDFELDGNCLRIRYSISNPGTSPLPCSIGAHPAFNWPIAPNHSRDDHRIVFQQNEPAPISRLDNGLLKADEIASPVVGNELLLDDALFVDDAIIFTRHQSRQVRYQGPQGPTIRVDFEDFPHLGIWTVPGAGFVCIEPWQGHSSPVNFTGNFSEKPGAVTITPGGQQQWTMSVTVE